MHLLLQRDVSRGFGVISCSTIARCCVNNAEYAGDPGKRFPQLTSRFYTSGISRKQTLLSRHRDSSMSIFKMFKKTCDFGVVVILHNAKCIFFTLIRSCMGGGGQDMTFKEHYKVPHGYKCVLTVDVGTRIDCDYHTGRFVLTGCLSCRMSGVTTTGWAQSVHTLSWSVWLHF